jgi:hypothetical protein
VISFAAQTSTIVTQQTPSLEGLQSNPEAYAIFSQSRVYFFGISDSLYSTTYGFEMGFVRQLDQS